LRKKAMPGLPDYRQAARFFHGGALSEIIFPRPDRADPLKNAPYLAITDALFAGAALSTSGVDLTFATHPAASSSGECQIQNSTGNSNLPVVL
jgi:hypothetical protein